jgi:hypothetical protein
VRAVGCVTHGHEAVPLSRGRRQRPGILWGVTDAVRRGIWAGTALLVAALVLVTYAGAVDGPRYDVPPGYTRCPDARAWNGFFKWASARRTTCRHAADFMRAYARRATPGHMPRRLRGFRCRIRYWRNEQGDIYASRHTCVRGRVVIRFYGMV